MSGQNQVIPHDPAAGRLPPLMIEHAISERQFRRLVERWRGRGLWISLWSSTGQCVSDDDSAGPFWDLWRGRDAMPASNAFFAGLDAAVKQVLASDHLSKQSDSFQFVSFEPAPEDFRVISISVRLRRRCVGVLMAVAAARGPGDEDFSRLCDECGVDRTLALRLRDQMPDPAVAAHAWPSLLALTVEQARELDIAQSEISSLTNNLESTYEELHLIYEISRLMGIPQKPTQMLERVSREMLEVSRAAGMAFVLGRKDPNDAGERRGETDLEKSPSDHVVHVGSAAPSLEDVLRLDACLPMHQKLETDHILHNKAYARPEFEWASSWLRHFVALPLRLDGELLGVFYGLNVVDDGDYTSVDIQLLKAVADRISAALKNQHLYDDLADLLMGLMHALVNSVDAKDPYTFGHSERVAYFSRAIAQAYGMSPIDCERVYLAGLLHDVGKIGVPDAILTKPGKLTGEEFEALKKHPEIGERILSHIRQLRDLLPGVLYHHERMDGRGYPHGLSGAEIPILGRIICLADSFDAMTSNRTYRAALPIAMATAEIRRCSGNQFDPALAELFLRIGPAKLYEEAAENTKGDPNIARIGALCAVLSGRPRLSNLEVPNR